MSRYLPLGEGLNERAGSAEARPGRTPRLQRPPLPEPEDACSRGAEGSGKQQIPEASSGSVCVLRGIGSALVPLSTFLRFLLIPAGKKQNKTKQGKLNVSVADWTAAERFTSVPPQMTSSDGAVTIQFNKVGFGFSAAEDKMFIVV